MQSFEDVANSLGQLVVQISANAVRSNELAKSTQETYETTLNYLQEMRKTQKAQQELIEEQKQRLEEQTDEPPSKKLRTGEPWAKSRKDTARSEYAESQVESQSGFLCYRCHKHCGSSAKNCEVEIPDLEMSSVLDLYTRVAHRGKNDERNEFDKVVREFGRRGYRLPEDGKVAKRMREALQLYKTPITPGVVITEVSEAEEREEDPEPTAVDQNPEVRRLREDVQKFMRDVMGTLGKIGLPGSQSKGSTDK